MSAFAWRREPARWGYGSAPSKPTRTSYDEFVSRILPEDRERTKQTIAEAVGSNRGFTNEYRIVWPDGTIRWLVDEARIVERREGEGRSLIGTVQDISERKSAEASLRDSERFLEKTLQQSPFAMWISDAEGVIIKTNKSLRDSDILT